MRYLLFVGNQPSRTEQHVDNTEIKRRPTLHEEVVQRLRDMIVEGQIEPGGRINEGAIGAQLGVSRTPLREAIKTLVGEGLVDIVQTKGAIVHVFSEKELHDTLETLKILEENAGRLACQNASDAAIAGIEQMHLTMVKHFNAGERLEYFKLNQAIHSAIVAAAGNDVLMATHEMLQARVKRARFEGHGEKKRWAEAVGEHEEMIVALKSRNASALAEVLGRHMSLAFERVRYLFSDKEK